MPNTTKLWIGWKLIEPEKAKGGAAARTYNRLKNKRRRQEQVLEMIAADLPSLLSGDHDVVVRDALIEKWVSAINKGEGISIYDVRDQINFLASSLERGKQQMGWKVSPPSPIRLLRREASPFTVDSFSSLNEFRDWQANIESRLTFLDFDIERQNETLTKKSNAEHTSWGLVLYSAVTRDAVLNKKYLNSLPLFADTLCIGKGMAWITFYDQEEKEDEKDAANLIRWRWILSPSSLALLLRHIDIFGRPKVEDIKEAQRYTQQSWQAMCRLFGVEKNSLSKVTSMLETTFSFQMPPYLVGGLRGRHVSTSLPEHRWRQLLLGGQNLLTSSEKRLDNAVELGAKRITINADFDKGSSLFDSANILKSLKGAVYKRRNERRLSHSELTQRLIGIESKAISAAPIIHAFSLWTIQLHKEKLKPSTIYRYLTAVGKPLFLTLGGSVVEPEHALELSKAYDEVIEKTKTQKSKRYRQVVLARFHRFLVQECDFPAVNIGGHDTRITPGNSDANIVSEKEYELICSAILSSEHSSLIRICYWIFILGYRAGLRISEALSVQLADIIMPDSNVDDAELVLIVKQNAFVDTKAYDSRRLLPLHLLLNESELIAFRDFCQYRRETNTSRRTMLFREGRDESAPLMDNIVHPIIHGAMRAVTGDQNLRFQHLRHTFANNLLLAYHRVVPPWSHPKHLEKIVGELNATYTRTGLYFISQLTGHQSPYTTLTDYLHCIELIQQHYCNLKLEWGADRNGSISPEKQLEPFLSILGIKQSRIRKWKERYGNDYSEWLTRGFPKVMVSRLSEGAVALYGEPRIQISAERTLDRLSLNEVEALVFADGKTPDELDRIFRLKKGSCEKLLASYSNFLYIPSKNQKNDFRHTRPSVYADDKKKIFRENKIQRALIPLTPPRSHAHKKLSEVVFSKIFLNFDPVNDLITVREKLLLFHDGHRARDGYIYIRNAEDGIDFINWLLSLGSGYHVVVNVTGASLSDVSIENQILYWKKGLSNYTTRAEVRLEKEGRIKCHRYGTAFIKVRALSAINMQEFSADVDSSWAVRYALFMACVVMTSIRENEV
ncbi:MAG: site-specific integrase [Zhongshania sp.]|nr:site-specific integrase [Zhongshania sp.]